MALMRCNFFSNALGMASSMNVILPDASWPEPTEATPLPCMLLLHGVSDDDTIWQRRTAIERYVRDLRLAVVMPNVHRSFYTDMEYGYRYWTFISEEVPAVCREFFGISDRREDNFVAGLSMGGYGAFKLALALPDRFCAGASLSGALDLANHDVQVPSQVEERDKDRFLVFGEGSIRGTAADLFTLADRLVASDSEPPALYQWCGTDDFLYPDNVRFRDHANAIGLELDYREDPGGHDWEHWDRQIEHVLEWLPWGGTE